jgi:hypothetical protein
MAEEVKIIYSINYYVHILIHFLIKNWYEFQFIYGSIFFSFWVILIEISSWNKLFVNSNKVEFELKKNSYQT